ncbi:hypothetical protein Syun_022932 [Stephania yunnanensis]|uniref:DUF4219 domain-containing protein n=1 Tax=Stephania yunnanensis TaxID=152371 RepID=A0AAP0I331_9MAGN
MQTLDPARLREGNSSSRPPYFDGTNYAHWKVRMKFYIRAQNRFLWDAIESGYTPPDKPLKEYTAEEIKIELSNDQAMNHLFCALSENEFNRVSACQTTKEVWEKLGVHYEGTMQVKKTKLRILEEHYETFRVGSDEDIATAITRFTKLLNEIKNLGKNYDQETSLYKFHRGWPKEWDAKKYAIQSAQNLGNYTFDALCGELTVHEFELKDRARLEALSGGTKSSRKDIALKANSSPSASVEIIENEKSCDDNDLEEEVAMLSRKLNRAMYKRDKYKKKFQVEAREENQMKPYASVAANRVTSRRIANPRRCLTRRKERRVSKQLGMTYHHQVRNPNRKVRRQYFVSWHKARMRGRAPHGTWIVGAQDT